MRAIESSTVFRKELKQIQKTPRHLDVPTLLEAVLEILASDMPLSAKYKDHALKGSYRGFRDCHIKPDVVLIYGKPNATTIWLARIGSHSEVF